METADAVKHITEQFKTDPDYRFGWQSNIAMAFVDAFNAEQCEVGAQMDVNVHRVANVGADRFLRILETFAAEK
jgi:hypothetical protein